MKFLIGVVLFVVAYVISLATSLGGMGYVGGRDIGFAGAGLWFVMVPAALIGTLLAYPVSRSLSEEAGGRRFFFLLAAPLCAWFLGALTMRTFDVVMHWSVPDPVVVEEPYVYVPGQDFAPYLSLEIPAAAFENKPTEIRIVHHAEPWQRVKLSTVKPDTPYFEQPTVDDPRLMSEPVFKTEPEGCMRVTQLDRKTGKATAVFARSDWGCTAWVTYTLPIYGGESRQSRVSSVYVHR